MVSRYLAREHRRYEYISPGALYETSVQALVERHIPSLWPGYWGVRLEPLFETSGGDVQPDLVLVNRRHGSWAVVEVELEGHSVKSHVLPQLSKLCRARGDERLAQQLIERGLSQMSLERLSEIVVQRPNVFLVTHGSTLAYSAKLADLGVEALDIDIHAHPPNDYVLEVRDRTSRFVALECVARRSVRSLTPYLWTVVGELPASVLARSHVRVEVDSLAANWTLRVASDGIILRQPTDLPLGQQVVQGRVLWSPESDSLRIVTGEG